MSQSDLCGKKALSRIMLQMIAAATSRVRITEEKHDQMQPAA